MPDGSSRLEYRPEQSPQKIEHHVLSPFFYHHFLRRFFVLRNERGRMSSSLDNIRFSPGLEEKEGKLKYLLYLAKKMFGGMFQGKESEFKKLLADIKLRNFATEEEMLTTVSNEICQFAKNNFTREELEQNYRERRKGKIPLTEFFDCDRDVKNKERLRLHLLGTSDLSLGKIKQGFGILAEKLLTDLQLKGVEVISTTSWMIKDRPEFFEKLGFTVLEMSPTEEATGVRRSEISKTKFLELYGNKNTLN